jgi:hypothetical protein
MPDLLFMLFISSNEMKSIVTFFTIWKRTKRILLSFGLLSHMNESVELVALLWARFLVYGKYLPLLKSPDMQVSFDCDISCKSIEEIFRFLHVCVKSKKQFSKLLLKKWKKNEWRRKTNQDIHCVFAIRYIRQPSKRILLFVCLNHLFIIAM